MDRRFHLRKRVAVLVPQRDFDLRIVGMPTDDASINRLANRYHVSREVILRKLLDRGVVDQAYYEEKALEWTASAKKSSGGGGDYYRNQGVYLSERYLDTAFSRYYQNRISIDQLADYLMVKVRNIPGMENLLLRRGASV